MQYTKAETLKSIYRRDNQRTYQRMCEFSREMSSLVFSCRKVQCKDQDRHGVGTSYRISRKDTLIRSLFSAN